MSPNFSLRPRILRSRRRFARRKRGRFRSELSREQPARCFGCTGGILLHRRGLEQLAFVAKNFSGDLDDCRAQPVRLVSDKILGADCSARRRHDVDLTNFVAASDQRALRTVPNRADAKIAENMRNHSVLDNSRRDCLLCDLAGIFVSLLSLDKR